MKKLTALIVALFLLSGIGFAAAETVTPADTAGSTATAELSPEALLQQWYDIGAQLRANGLYPFTELKKGDAGYEVRALQTRLAELGYYAKAVVDEFGKGTYTAMRRFEKINGLKVNGVASVKDQQLLFSDSALADTGEALSSGGNTSSGGKSSSGNADATSGATN